MLRSIVAVMLGVLLSGCAFVKVNVASEPGAVEEQVVSGEGRAKIAVVDVSGILSLGRLGLDRFSKEPPLLSRLKEELETALGDDDVVGLVVRVNSPGGSVTASDILYHELEEFGRRKGAVVACVMDKGVSGGYYAALAAREIFAHPTSLVGGVGVVSFKITLGEMLQKWGVEVDTVKSGALKDFWSPLRPSPPEEVALMQGITDRLHERFMGLVEKNRRLAPGTLEMVATGRIFAADEALELGLVDRLGYLEDAVGRVRELAGVEEARVIIYRRPGGYAGSIYAGSPFADIFPAERAAAELLSPSFRYQFMP